MSIYMLRQFNATLTTLSAKLFNACSPKLSSLSNSNKNVCNYLALTHELYCERAQAERS